MNADPGERYASHTGATRPAGDEGMALVIALIALSVTSVLGLCMFLNAMVQVRISDNDEARSRARRAAEAGIGHARALLKGLSFDELLKGPDGTYEAGDSYLSQARAHSFRNPLPWQTARLLTVLDPSGEVAGIADDGLMSTGRYGGSNGTVLVPLQGIAFTVQDPYRDGNITLARYFIRVADNNGEDTELARDENDNPFYDGDGMILVRSMGVAPTIREVSGMEVRANAVAVIEARFQIQRQFDLLASIVVLGREMKTRFEGNEFLIDGEANSLGIATLDPGVVGDNPDENSEYDNTEDSGLVEGPIIENLQADQLARVLGKGLIPSVGDISDEVSADRDQAKLLDPNYLWDFVTNQVPTFADNVFSKRQDWKDNNAPDIGSYDINKCPGDPSQQPKVTFVDGELKMQGAVTGGGLLVVKGKLKMEDNARFNGLVLVLGTGKVTLKTTGGINGALYQIGLKSGGHGFKFVQVNLAVEETCRVIYNRDAIRTALVLMPIRQISIREVTPAMDP